MRVEDILPKEDSFEKLQAVQGKPQKNFIFAPEFNAVVESLKEVKKEVEKPKVEAILTPEFYGAKGDGIADDTQALKQCFDKGRELKKVVFLTGNYKTNETLNVSNLTLLSKNAKFIADFNSFVLSAIGSRSNYIRISKDFNINKGDTYLELATASEVNSLNLKAGDLIKIRSMGVVFDPDLGLTRGGEIQRVHSVEGNKIHINGSFEDTYQGIESHQTEVCKINPTRFENLGLLTIEQNAKINSCGLLLDFCDSPRVDFRFINCYERSLVVKDSYGAVCRLESDNSINPGLGYGLSIVNSTMYGRYTGIVNGARHCVATGSDGAERGVSWGNLIHDFIGVAGTNLAVYDTHASTGSVTYERCIAKGISERLGIPLVSVGFQLNSINYIIKDCQVINCSNAINILKSGRKYENVVIENLTCENVSRHIIALGGTASFKSLIIKGVKSRCINFLSPIGFDNVALNFSPTSAMVIDKIVVEDIDIVNHQCAIHISNNISFPNGVVLDKIRHEYTVLPPNALNDYNNTIRIQNTSGFEIKIMNCESINVSLLRTHFSTVTPSITLKNCKVKEGRQSLIWINNDINTLKIIGCEFEVNVPSITAFFLRTENVTNLLVANCTISGSNLFGIFRNNSTITNFQEGINILTGTRQISSGGIFPDLSFLVQQIQFR